MSEVGLRPLGRMMIVKSELETRSKGGIIIPDQQRKMSTKANVLSVGGDVKEVEVGDTVLLNAQSNELQGDYFKGLFVDEVDDKTYTTFMISESSVLCIIDDLKVIDKLKRDV